MFITLLNIGLSPQQAKYFKVRALRKSHKIILDPSHPLYLDLELLPTGHRYRAPLSKKNRTRPSFVPGVISLLNSSADVPIESVRPAG
jgi:hypothetical protein